MTTVDELYKRFYVSETVDAYLADGRFIRDISHNDDGSFYIWTDNGELSSDGERMVIIRSSKPIPTPPTITGPVLTTGGRKDATYYEVVVTYQHMPLRYRLHNEWDYGIDCRGAMPDCAPSWYGTNMTVAALDLPPETIQSLREIWDSLFRAPPTVSTPEPAPPVDDGPDDNFGGFRSIPHIHRRLVDGQFTTEGVPPCERCIAEYQATVVQRQPAYTLTEQLEALRKEAHAAHRQGLTQVVALLKERACALAESYLDLEDMCDKGHWLNEYGHCETCLEAAQQLTCARAHVDPPMGVRG